MDFIGTKWSPPNSSAFFQINKKFSQRSVGVSDVMCSVSLRSAFVGAESLQRQEAEHSLLFPSAWPSNCRGSPNNGIPLLLDANTHDLLDVGLKCIPLLNRLTQRKLLQKTNKYSRRKKGSVTIPLVKLFLHWLRFSLCSQFPDFMQRR